jgi:hypothetical protein
LAEGVAVGLTIADVNPAGTDVHAYEYVPDPPLAPAFSCTLAPAHIVPGVAAGDALNDPPVTDIVTASELEHPVAFIVAVKVKVVLFDKFNVNGSSTAAFTSNEDGVQLYVNGPVPVTVPFSEVLVPFAIFASLPALTPGKGFTVTDVAADDALWHPFALVTLTV